VRFDARGAVTATAAVATLVFGLSAAGSLGWRSPTTLSLLATATVLAIALVRVELATEAPIIPFRLMRVHPRLAAYLASFLSSIGIFAMFVFVSVLLQTVLGYEPLPASLLSLPFSVCVAFTTMASGRLAARYSLRGLGGVGLAMATVGFAWYSFISPDSTYLGGVLAPMVLVGVGFGLTFVPLSATALSRLPSEDTGVMSAALTTAQVVGGSIGLALLTTVAASVSTTRAEELLPWSTPDTVVEGFSVAFGLSAIVMGITAGLWLAMTRNRSGIPGRSSAHRP
jgi:predicted MFS family arabinose efflux permease